MLETFIGCFFAFLAYTGLKLLFGKYVTKSKNDTNISMSIPGFNMGSLTAAVVKSDETPETKVPTFEENLAALEKARGTKIFFLSHSIGSTTRNALSTLMNSKSEIGYSDALDFVTTLRKVSDEQPLDIIVNTPGGSFAATEVIINALLTHKGHINIFVPFCAYSGGTLIAFAGNQIHLGKNASLGPVDSQRFGFSVPSIYRALPSGNDSIFAMLWSLLREQCKKDMDRTETLLDRLNTSQPEWSEDVRKRITDTFVSGQKFDHDQPLFFENISFLGNVTPTIPDEIYDIYQKYQDNIKPPSRGLLGGLL